MDMLELIGVVWEAIVGLESDDPVKRIAAIISVALLVLLGLFLAAMVLSGRVTF